jgi:hypothetical protein
MWNELVQSGDVAGYSKTIETTYLTTRADNPKDNLYNLVKLF